MRAEASAEDPGAEDALLTLAATEASAEEPGDEDALLTLAAAVESAEDPGDEDALLALAATVKSEAHARYTHEIPRVAAPAGDDRSFGEEFARRYVAPSLPVVLTGCCDGWPAHRRWNHDYLRSVLGSTLVHVALTPNGLADAITPIDSADLAGKGQGTRSPCKSGALVFAKPLEVRMAFDSLLDVLERPLVDDANRTRVCSTVGYDLVLQQWYPL